MYIISFALVDNRVEIKNNYNYLEEKIEKISEQLGLNRHEYCFEELELCDYVILDNCTDFCLTFTYDDNKYEIYFTFATYNNTKQLKININSNITNQELEFNTINKSKNFTEQLKICLKDNILYSDYKKSEKEWEKCIWLLDRQSEIYASNLYIKIYMTENLLREFINNVMIRVYGVNWWNEVIPENISSKKDNSKIKAYKDTVYSLKDIDEILMCLDIVDLIDILKLKFYKWKCTSDIIIEKNIIALKKRLNQTKIVNMSTREIASINAILEKLVSQLEEKGNLWDEYFSKYLDDKFLDKIRIFNKNRNHIAHNKLVDRQAYESIQTNINFISDSLKKAINQFDLDFKSLEMDELERRVNQYDDYIEELMESESGVNINSTEQILHIFENTIEDLYKEISDRLRFRTDIETEIYIDVRLNEYDEESFFKIYSLVTKEEIEINCISSIDDSEGEVSELNIGLKYNEEIIKNYTITYTNGAISYDSEQCTYIPEIEDKINEEEFNECIDNIVDIVDEKLENMR